MKIDKDIPAPEDLFPAVYPFAKMEVGDSVTQVRKAGKKMAQAARMNAARHLEWDCVTGRLDTDATRLANEVAG